MLENLVAAPGCTSVGAVLSPDLRPAALALLGVMVGAGVGYLGGYFDRRHERNMAELDRAANLAAARGTYEADVLAEQQALIVKLTQAVLGYRTAAVSHAGRQGRPEADAKLATKAARLGEVMTVINALVPRLPAGSTLQGKMLDMTDAAMDLLEADHKTTDLGPLVDAWTDLAGGVGDHIANRMLDLPPPSTYHPLSPWAVTWDS